MICFTTGHESAGRRRHFRRFRFTGSGSLANAFPPESVEVVSWYVTMGIGQVVTPRLPASRLHEVNRILENTAWGSYRTEFCPTYDY
jgi:hypothetical protein